MELKYHWEVVLADGKTIQQVDNDGIEHLWKEVPIGEIRIFRWKAIGDGFVDHQWEIQPGDTVEPFRRNGVQLKLGEQIGPFTVSYNVKINNWLYTIHSDGRYETKEV
jgi:hypothetical protein